MHSERVVDKWHLERKPLWVVLLPFVRVVTIPFAVGPIGVGTSRTGRGTTRSKPLDQLCWRLAYPVFKRQTSLGQIKLKEKCHKQISYFCRSKFFYIFNRSKMEKVRRKQGNTYSLFPWAKGNGRK
jgi:hypothetical protein